MFKGKDQDFSDIENQRLSFGMIFLKTGKIEKCDKHERDVSGMPAGDFNLC